MNTTTLIAPVMMAMMTPDNHLSRKDRYRKPVRSRKKDEAAEEKNRAAFYIPSDEETRLREFYMTYSR